MTSLRARKRPGGERGERCSGRLPTRGVVWHSARVTDTELNYIYGLMQRLGWNEGQALRRTNLEHCGPIKNFPWALSRSLTGQLERACANVRAEHQDTRRNVQEQTAAEGPPATVPMTAPQKAYLQALLKKADLSEKEACKRFRCTSLDAVGKRQASLLIHELRNRAS